MTSKFEFEMINNIANRAIRMGLLQRDKLTLMMDLEYAHKDCPMNLCALLEAEPFDFSHDVCGIQNHMDRETKKLTDLFCPRFAI